MNLTYPTQSTNPEVRQTMSFNQTQPEVANLSTGGLSVPDAEAVPVIARIPDVDSPASPPRRRRSSRVRTTKPTTNTRRILNASLSLKLLIGLGLFLMVGAVAQNVIIKITDSSVSKNGTASDQAWQLPPPAPTADIAPSWKPPQADPPSSPGSWPNISESPIISSQKLTASASTYSVEKEKPLNTDAINPTDASNLVGWDNNIVQPTETPATANRATGIGSGISTSLKSGNVESKSTADAQVSAWPRSVDDAPIYSPWPNPAHPLVAQTNYPSTTELTQGVEHSYNKSNTIPVIANRPMVIGATSPAKLGKKVEQNDYRTDSAADPRHNDSITADRRNAPASPETIRMPSLPPRSNSEATQRYYINETGSTQLEGTIDTTTDRYDYDRSRQSIH
jgi:hypothetical protein